MMTLKKITTLFAVIFLCSTAFSQGNYFITSMYDTITSPYYCDSVLDVSIAPQYPDFNSSADIVLFTDGTNFSAGPVTLVVDWGDGTTTNHTGQMTAEGQSISFSPAVSHSYLSYNVYTAVFNVTNPVNNSSASFTSQIQYQDCSTGIYGYLSMNCPSADPNIVNSVPFVFTGTSGYTFTETLQNGMVISNQVQPDTYNVTIAQWWLDMNNVVVTGGGPSTMQMSPGGAYTFQFFIECDSTQLLHCLSGNVFCDDNQNGIFDNGEMPIPNAPIVLQSGNQTFNTVSNPNGYYIYDYYSNGNNYSTLQIDPTWLSQNGYSSNYGMLTIVDSLCSAGGQYINLPINCDSSAFQEECIGGWVFCDENDNGILDSNESGFANAPVHIQGQNGTVTVYTNGNGNFFYYGNQLGGTAAVVTIDQAWLAQNGYYASGPVVTTVMVDCNLTQPVYFPIDCDSLQTPCADLWTTVEPWIGYYQNTTNYIKLKWGNNGPAAAQSYTLSLTFPAGVTPVTSSFANQSYVISGNTISWTVSTSSTYFTSSDVIYFNVPGGLSNGTVHNYSSTITANGNNQDCCLLNNNGSLDMILGNSYDPNDKTVNNSEIISPSVDDELVYRIRFQNTGTAPAQHIYIMDTLSDNLDWSTFELMDASHYIQVIDLGNGVMKFNFPSIWLPDSTTNLEASQGSLTYRITENAGNGIGTTIENTAHIFFDFNPAIVTNTTYNINNVLNVEMVEAKNFLVYPNPTTAILYIRSENNVSSIKVVDVSGQIVQQYNGDSIQSIDMTELIPGVYFVELTSNGAQVVQKVMKR